MTEDLGLYPDQPEPVLVDVDNITLADYNPRTISDREREALRASILTFGFVVPIVVQASTNMIIGGHQRIAVLREMYEDADNGKLIHNGRPVSIDDVPTQVYAVMMDVDDDTAKRLNVALNRIGGEFDEHKLGLLFESLTETTDLLGMLSMGFEEEEFRALIEATSGPDESLAQNLEEQSSGVVGTFGRSITMTLEFDTVEMRDEAKDSLAAICKPKGIKAGDLLLAAVRKGKLGKIPKPKEPKAK